ncbi:MAG: alpha-galactosidase, partial [Parabacteroides sp.]
MNKRLTITLLVMLLPLSTTFASDKTFRYAKEDNLVELKNDTLTIENDLIKRCWLWNNGNLITRSLVDKGNNIIWNTSNELPDLYIPHESKTATDADIQCEEIAESARYTKQLQIFISYKLGKIEVKKVIKIYPNC